MLFPHLLAVAIVQASEYVILNAQRDIEDLDIGDLSDMTSDVSPMFLDRLKYSGEKRESVMLFVTLNRQSERETRQLGSDWSVIKIIYLCIVRLCSRQGWSMLVFTLQSPASFY